MKCPICDRQDDSISYDKITEEFGVCGVCQIAIDECIDGYPKLPSEEIELEG